MPWDNDNDDDLDWFDKHFESRLRFFYDLKKGLVNRGMAQHIRLLLTEVRYIQQRREYLEFDMSDDDNDVNGTMRKTVFFLLSAIYLL